MHASAENLISALSSVVVSTAGCLTVIFLMAGPDDFGTMAAGSGVVVAVISLIAGIARLMVRKRGWVPSVLCGLIVAALGCAAIFVYALTRIQPAP